MRNPDFLIVGAQKAGTNMLWSLLGQHPQIELPEHKEYHYFNRDLDWPNHDSYRKNFTAAGDKLTGEATPGYCFWPGAMERIARFDPDKRLRLIMLLRDPAERAISHYWMEFNRGFERLPIDQALVPLDERLASGHSAYPLDCGYSRGMVYALFYHSYLLRGIYHAQLDAIYSLYPGQRVMILMSDGLRTEPAHVANIVYKFLDLPQFTPRDVAARHTGTYPEPSDSLMDRLAAFFEEPNRLLKEKHGIENYWWNAVRSRSQ